MRTETHIPSPAPREIQPPADDMHPLLSNALLGLDRAISQLPNPVKKRIEDGLGAGITLINSFLSWRYPYDPYKDGTIVDVAHGPEGEFTYTPTDKPREDALQLVLTGPANHLGIVANKPGHEPVSEQPAPPQTLLDTPEALNQIESLGSAIGVNPEVLARRYLDVLARVPEDDRDVVMKEVISRILTHDIPATFTAALRYMGGSPIANQLQLAAELAAEIPLHFTDGARTYGGITYEQIALEIGETQAALDLEDTRIDYPQFIGWLLGTKHRRFGETMNTRLQSYDPALARVQQPERPDNPLALTMAISQHLGGYDSRMGESFNAGFSAGSTTIPGRNELALYQTLTHQVMSLFSNQNQTSPSHQQ